MANDAGWKNKRVSTAGEVFPDGTALELVEDPSAPERCQLLYWKGEAYDVGPSIQHQDMDYVPIDLEQLAALHLPTGVGQEEPVRQLFLDLHKRLSTVLGQRKQTVTKLILLILASWIPERLPVSPLLWIVACGTSPKHSVEKLLKRLVRHGLVIPRLAAADFNQLPWVLQPTLIADGCEMKASFLERLRASCLQGTTIFHQKRTLNTYGPKVVLSKDLLGNQYSDEGMLQATLVPTPGQVSFLDEKTLRQISDEFQPRLLSFRLRNLGKICTPAFDVSQFTPPAQALATALATTVVGDERLEKVVVQLLTDEEKESRLDRSRTVDAVLAEAILCFCHEQDQKKIRSADLAQRVNAIYAGRGSSEEVSAETVGWALRRLGIARARIGSAGNGIELTDSTRRIAHKAALSLCAPGTLLGSGCKYCEEFTNSDHPVGPSKAAPIGDGGL